MKRSTKRWLAVGFTVFGLAAMGGGAGLAWHLREHRTDFFTDADTIDRLATETSPRDILWRPPLDLVRPVNSVTDDFAPSVTADGRSLFFARGETGRNADLYWCQKTSTGWSVPQPLPLNTEADELDPQVSPDGTVLFFCSNRAGGEGEYDLWVSRREGEAWTAPVNLGPGINSRQDDYGPGLTPDGATLYFASNRPASGRTGPGDFDLYQVSVRDAEPVVVALSNINTEFDDTAPSVSPAGDFVYFASDRPGGEGGFDLYRSRRIAGDHTAAVNLGDDVNTPANELDPAVTLEGFGLYYASGDAETDYDLRYTTSREVFMRTESHRATLNWGTLWPTVWPYLLWMLATVVLMLVLIGFLQKLEYRKLSLLAKCMLVSLLVHMLLMLSFAFWGVTAAISKWQRPGQGMRVVLTSPSIGAGLAQQIRGELTAVELQVRLPETQGDRPAESPLPRMEPASAAPPATVELTRIESEPALEAAGHDAPPQTAPPTPLFQTASVASPVPVELDTPSEQARSRQSEAVASTNATERAAPPRAETLVASIPPDAPITLALVPAAAEALGADTDPRHFADAAPRRGSAPPGPMVQTAASVDRAEPVRLETPSEQMRSRGGEAAMPPDVATVEVDARRAEPVMKAEPPVTATIAVVAATTTTAASPDEHFADAAPRRASTPVAMRSYVATETDSIDPATFAVALPSAEPPREETPEAAEAAPNPGAMAAVPALQPIAVPEAATRSRPDFAAAQIEPHAEPGDPAAVSLAAVRPREAPILLASRDDVALAIDAPRNPVPFELPLVEGSSVASEPERRVELRVVPEDAPRVHLRLPVRTPSRDVAPAAPSSQVLATPIWDDRFRPTRIDIDPQRVRVSAPDAMVLASLDLDLKVPTRTSPAPEAFRHRAADVREKVLEKMGGTRQTERAVAMALDWLARHQGPDGRWNGSHFDDDCGQCSGTQRVKCDVALTGLALLCFQAADHTHTREGPYRRAVERGLNWLLMHQKDNGDLMFGESMYSQGIAAIALAEAYGMTQDPRLRPAVESAVDFIFKARNKFVGGWRYRPGQVGDTSVLGWQIMALQSARRARIDVPDEAFEVAGNWLELVHRPGKPGLYAYQPQREITPAMTAEGMFVRQLLGATRDDMRQKESASYLLHNEPQWDPDANTYYWYYGTLAMFQHQGQEWETWNESIKQVLLENQRTEGLAAGSWDPEGRWAAVAGRVYQTAMATLTLEVYYRYLPQFLKEE